MIGEEVALAWLATRWILAAFGKTGAEAVERYAHFASED
jgi:hypothetical protein